MITLLLLFLFMLAVIYAVFFCVLKLIWVIFKRERNFWPLVLAGVGTLGVALIVGCGTYMVFQKLTAPVRQMIADIKANPQPIIGERTYKDTAYPFEMTVYDGMDFSDWVVLDNIAIKGGIDTNIFKKGYDDKKPFLMAAVVRTPEDETDPFKAFKEAMHNGNTRTQYRVKINREGATEINGFSAYEMDVIFYSNKGPLDAKIVAVAAPDKHIYYVGVMSLGENSLTAHATAMLNSFRFITDDNLLPAADETSAATEA